MEALIHFVVPFAALVLMGVRVVEAAPIALLGVLPDLDILFHVHRSPTHSLVLITLAAAPFIAVLWLTGSRNFPHSLRGYLCAATHPVLDVFGGYTPVLWPLYGKSLWVESSVLVEYGSRMRMELSLELHRTPTRFPRRPVLTGALLTGEALMISLILVSAALYGLYTRRTGKGQQ
ncbi:MAG: metal-dependent hydrolase [Candidatus Bathyarchaeia archaeon]